VHAPDARHVKRKLAAVVLEGAEAPLAGAAVTDEAGAAVGEVTSAAPSPTLGKTVALAMIKRAQAEPGKGVVVGGARGKWWSAGVTVSLAP